MSMSISLHTGSNELVQRNMKLHFRLMPEGKDFYPILSFRTGDESLDMFPDIEQVSKIHDELGKLLEQYFNLMANDDSEF
jgi:hypothetical protein